MLANRQSIAHRRSRHGGDCAHAPPAAMAPERALRASGPCQTRPHSTVPAMPLVLWPHAWIRLSDRDLNLNPFFFISNSIQVQTSEIHIYLNIAPKIMKPVFLDSSFQSLSMKNMNMYNSFELNKFNLILESNSFN
jgi:hypothetical protein